MKIICNKETFLNYLNIAIKAVGNRSPQPILDCILINANEEGLFMTCTNLDLSIKTSAIESNIIEKGSIAVDARFLNEIVRKLDGEEITIETNDDRHAKIICGKVKYNILIQNYNDFPELETVDRSKKYQLKQVDLKNMLRQTMFSIGNDISKPMFTGELFEFKNQYLNLVSVDGFRISYRSCELTAFEEDKKVIVIGKNLNELSKVLSSEEEDLVDIYIENNQILFDVGVALIYSRTLDIEFINYEQSFTPDCSTEVIIQKSKFLQCLDRASLISRDDQKIPVVISLKDEVLEITAKSEMGTTFEEISCEIEGENMVIGFNTKYLKDAVRVIDDEMIKLKFIAPLSPCTILPIEGDEYKYLILPVRVEDN